MLPGHLDPGAGAISTGHAVCRDPDSPDSQCHFNKIRYARGVIWIVIKQVIAKGAKSESDQKQGKAECGQLFCFSADFCHATSQIFQR